MSQKEVIICDHCGKRIEQTSELFHTDYHADAYAGWWHVSCFTYHSPHCYDFCSLGCLSAWVASFNQGKD